MGLGTEVAHEGTSTFLSVAGGYIWDKKQGEDHPQFKVQEYKDNNDEIATRQGACYPTLAGQIVDVRINEHDKFGQSVQVTFLSDGDRYIVSIGTNNRFSQDMLKMLLKVDLAKSVKMKPYEFIDKLKGKRVQGIVFHEDGEKIVLRNEEAPFKDGDFFKTATKKQKNRFFEDLTEWFVDTVQTTVIDVHFTKDENGQLVKAVAPISTEVEAEAVKPAPAKKAPAKKATKAVMAKEATAEDLASEFDDLL
jgi:hypothetical protein